MLKFVSFSRLHFFMSTAQFILSAFKELLSISPRNMQIVGDSVPIPKFKEDDIRELINEFIIHNRGKTALVHINHDVIIVGDIHGNLDDLLRIFAFNGLPPEKNYLFLGDFVDHGHYSLECLLLLYSLSIVYPQYITLLRGNHEFKDVNKNHEFYHDIMGLYNSEELFDSFNSSFDYLALCAVLKNKYFCVHGGISVHLRSLAIVESQLLPITHITPLIEDMIWSDPIPGEVWYGKSQRGIGKTFGKLATRKFLSDHDFEGIIRAHQCVMGGTTLHQDGLVMTIFSASDYEGTDNRSGYLVCEETLKPFSIEPLPHEIKRKDAFFFEVSKDNTGKNFKAKTMLQSFSSNTVHNHPRCRSFLNSSLNQPIARATLRVIPRPKILMH